MSNLELAFIYGVATLALETARSGGASSDEPDGLLCAESLLGQTGYDAAVVQGLKCGRPYKWIEIGHEKSEREVIVNMSPPLSPHDTVIRKKSLKGSEYNSQSTALD